MRELGLNKRASEARKRLGPRLRKRSRTSLTSGSGLARASRIRDDLAQESATVTGISADDRKEIENEIEVVSRKSRISAKPEDFIVRPRRKGFVFPLAVNVLALAATGLAIFFLSRLFSQRDLEIASTAASLETAEGKLLRELKRDSESRLLEKDRAIADFRARLIEIDRERAELASNIDERVGAREAELRAVLRKEVDAERERLSAERMSEAARESRLKSYEAERTAALDRLLAESRAQADAEKAAAEARFAQLQEDYRKSIAALGEDRKKLQDEASRREAEIRAQAEASVAAIAAQGAAARAGLESARAELAALERQKALKSSVEERVLGLYDGIRAALRERRYEAAASAAAALVSYMNEPEIAADASLKARRDADIFVAETLGVYARSELARAAIDSAKLFEQASILAAARESALAAQAALESGNASEARARYAEALEKVPEILAAHDYFMERAQAEETARREELEKDLSAAEQAFRSGDFEAMARRYAKALDYLPIKAADRQSIVARIGRAAVASAEESAPPAAATSAAAMAAASAAARSNAAAERAAADTRAARPLAERASRFLASGLWHSAIAGYIELLSAYPAAEQAGEALSGIKAANESMSASAVAAEAEAKEKIKAEIERAEAAAARAESAKAELESSKQSELALKAEIEDLKLRLANAREETADTAAAVAPAESAAVAAARDGRLVELETEVKRLSGVASRYDELVSTYKEYRASDSSSGAGDGGQAALVASSAKLDAFLDSEAARESLPGLRESVARYQQAYLRAGQREVLFNALDLLEGAVRLKDAAARDRYFSDLESRFAGDEGMLSFIAGLRRSVK